MQISDWRAKPGPLDGSVIVLATPPVAVVDWNDAGRQKDD